MDSSFIHCILRDLIAKAISFVSVSRVLLRRSLWFVSGGLAAGQPGASLGEPRSAIKGLSGAAASSSIQHAAGRPPAVRLATTPHSPMGPAGQLPSLVVVAVERRQPAPLAPGPASLPRTSFRG